MSNSLFLSKISQIRCLMIQQGLDGIKLALQKNVSWLLGGRSHVNTASEPACCQFLITKQECFLVVNNIEASRLLEEEAEELGTIKVHIWPWQLPARREELTAELLASTRLVKSDAELEGVLLDLRTQVPHEHRDEWRILGQRTADAIEQAAIELRKGQSEYEIAGLLARHCWEREIEPIVNLIAVDERIYTRRHPLPTGRKLNKYAMLVICARCKGMIASATRLVHFGKVDSGLQAKHEAVALIDARLIDASRPGVTLGELYDNMVTFYREAGYPDEYTHHHQGGLTGYSSRERLLTPGDSYVLQANQAVAWNPSISGVKSEDTILTSEESCSMPQILTASSADSSFPTIQVKVGETLWKRSGILIR